MVLTSIASCCVNYEYRCSIFIMRPPPQEKNIWYFGCIVMCFLLVILFHSVFGGWMYSQQAEMKGMKRQMCNVFVQSLNKIKLCCYRRPVFVWYNMLQSFVFSHHALIRTAPPSCGQTWHYGWNVSMKICRHTRFIETFSVQRNSPLHTRSQAANRKYLLL